MSLKNNLKFTQVCTRQLSTNYILFYVVCKGTLYIISKRNVPIYQYIHTSDYYARENFHFQEIFYIRGIYVLYVVYSIYTWVHNFVCISLFTFCSAS